MYSIHLSFIILEVHAYNGAKFGKILCCRLLKNRLYCNVNNDSKLLFCMKNTSYGVCRTSNLPALFVFGKSPINVANCAKSFFNHASINGKPFVVRYITSVSL